MLYLVDTSAWIPALRGEGNESAAKTVAGILDEDHAATCPVVMLELLSGVKSENLHRELLADLKALHFVPITDAVWEFAWKLGFALRRKGIAVPATDALIASAAMRAGCIVLHRDRHFDLIAKHTALRVRSV